MKNLGLHRAITRRDFLDGVRIAVAGSIAGYTNVLIRNWTSFQKLGAERIYYPQPFGRIHVANSDAAASAYTHAAIDEAHRAVAEIVGSKESENAV